MKKDISFILNGERLKVGVETHWTLLYLLREVLDLTGAKRAAVWGSVVRVRLL